MSDSGSMPALDMGDVAVLEAAHDMGDGVAFADVGEELVAEPFALRGAAHETGDVDEGQTGRDDFLRAGDFRESRQPRVRHRHLADVGLDRAERIIGRLGCGGLGQRVEERRFADVRQADDAAFETHGCEACSTGSRRPYARSAGKRQVHGPSKPHRRGPVQRAAVWVSFRPTAALKSRQHSRPGARLPPARRLVGRRHDRNLE